MCSGIGDGKELGEATGTGHSEGLPRLNVESGVKHREFAGKIKDCNVKSCITRSE